MQAPPSKESPTGKRENRIFLFVKLYSVQATLRAKAKETFTEKEEKGLGKADYLRTETYQTSRGSLTQLKKHMSGRYHAGGVGYPSFF